MTTVFIDGKAGTTGLRIYERLAERKDITLLSLSEEQRKDPKCRKEALNSCDIAFLCLPDVASQEAVAMMENPNVVLLDTSTAHRTATGWAYGFPELSSLHREKIQKAKRIAVPGCHASGFIALVYPLVQAGLLPAEAALSCFSLTGYSGGGKGMIAEYEAEGRADFYDAPRQYGLTQQHKHLKEMQAITGLQQTPLFSPIVADYYSGMEVTIPLFAHQLRGSVDEVKAVLQANYQSEIVHYTEWDEGGFCAANRLSGKDTMEICVAGNADRILLIARYDNLGKGASGAAVECMNLAMGQADTLSLSL